MNQTKCLPYVLTILIGCMSSGLLGQVTNKWSVGLGLESGLAHFPMVVGGSNVTSRPGTAWGLYATGEYRLTDRLAWGIKAHYLTGTGKIEGFYMDGTPGLAYLHLLKYTHGIVTSTLHIRFLQQKTSGYYAMIGLGTGKIWQEQVAIYQGIQQVYLGTSQWPGRPLTRPVPWCEVSIGWEKRPRSNRPGLLMGVYYSLPIARYSYYPVDAIIRFQSAGLTAMIII